MNRYLYDDEDAAPMSDSCYDLLLDMEKRYKDKTRERLDTESDGIRGQGRM